MMISEAAAVAAAAAAADGSVASVQDTSMPTAASAAAGEQQPKLTLEQKRELTMTWFTSQQVRIKDLPHGKAFVRRAAKDLKLVQLRKLRRSLSDEVQKANIDGMAHCRVLSYHPRKFAAQQDEQKNISEKKTSAPSTPSTPIILTTTSLDRNQIRSILLAFYGSTGRDAAPLGRHLRNCGVLAQKRDILAIVRSIGLRRMKRDGVSLEEAAAKLDEVLATVSFAEQKKADCTIVDCADHLDAMQIDTDDAAAPVATKAKRQATRIAERRAQRKAQRQAMVEAKRAARILKKKQQQNARKVSQKQQKQLPDKALSIIQSNASLRKLVQSEDAQTLLMEWYVDPSKPSMVDFLTSRDEMKGSGGDGDYSLLDTYKRPLRLLVKAGQLQRLRKAGAGRGKAARAVEGVLARASTTTPILQVSNDDVDFGVAKVSLKKNPNAAAALTSIKQDDLQKHLMQWFQDDSMPSVVDYLAANDLPPSLRPAMAHMIKQLGLRQLRKDRRMASVQARRRINGALKGKGGKVRLQDKGKEDATDGDVPTTSAILPSAPPAELLEEEDEYVSVSKEGGEEMKDDAPPSYDDAIAAEDKADLDLDFVVLH